MTKQYCDICGQEAETTKYILPFRHREKVKDGCGTLIKYFYVVKPVEVDLCTNCAWSINQSICYDIKNILDRNR